MPPPPLTPVPLLPRCSITTPVIRIKIDSIFASKLFKDNAALASNTAFLAKYKGFYIQCETQNNGEGVILNAISKMI
jgi:hypothetical protein